MSSDMLGGSPQVVLTLIVGQQFGSEPFSKQLINQCEHLVIDHHSWENMFDNMYYYVSLYLKKLLTIFAHHSEPEQNV